MAEIRIRPGEMRMGQTGDCARAGMVKTLHGRLRMGLWVRGGAVGVKESLGGSLVFRWVRESPGRATGVCISRGASKLARAVFLFPFSFTQPW